ncbi:MAG: DNA-formamidopyrimidine glycosylase [Parachlamydiaceae bacterium]|nr:DNA-formamidopyrimidine glycosylase [Parachlamydiaceae bacterium]
MPELPEVETIVRELCACHLVGTQIKEALVFWDRTIATPSPKEFCDSIGGQTILNISRRGKFIAFTLSNYTLIVHLRMTGKFFLSKKKLVSALHERVHLHLTNGWYLHYSDQRKFGKWYLVSNPEATFDKLGLEPFSNKFTLKAFQKVISRGTSQIKPFLLNQRNVAGLGNIYVDEALWESKIAPTRKASSLSLVEIKTLHKAIKHVLKQGIAHMGTSLGTTHANYFSVSGRRGFHQNQLMVFRRDGFPCPRCNTTIIKIKLAQRGTHLCPNCQK